MITPDQLAKSGSEAAHQTALFAWVAVATVYGFEVARSWAEDGETIEDALEHYGSTPCVAIPELKWLHHIPNGGSRGDNAESRAIRGGQLKAQGVRVGVADLCLPVRRAAWSGLYIEMKKPAEKPKREGSKGGVSDEQSEFGAFVISQGFCWCVCYSWQEAAETIQSYLEFGK